MATSRVVLPVLNLEQNDETLHKVVLKGAKNYTVQRIARDNQSATQIQFTVTPPSQNTVIDRRIDLEYDCVLTPAGGTAVFSEQCGAAGDYATKQTVGQPESLLPIAAGGAKTAVARIGNGYGLRQFPLASITQNLSVNINGTHISSAPREHVHAALCYTSAEFREQALDGVYHHPDTFNGNYDDLFAIAPAPLATGLTQKPKWDVENPLACQSSRKGECGRGFKFLDQEDLTVAETGNRVADTGFGTLRLKVREPLFISPFTLQYGEGMTNINQLKVEVTFDAAKIQRMISQITSSAVQNAECAINLTNFTQAHVADSAKLVVRYYTPQDDIRIPNEIVLPYNQNIRHTQQVANLDPDQSVAVSPGQNRRLNQVPEALYVWCAMPQTNGQMDQNRADGFANIVGINIQFQNQVGILSNASERDLYNIAKDNGGDWKDINEWRARGGVLKLQFGKDIPLPNNEAPGTRGDYDIMVQLSYKQNFFSATAADMALEVNELYIYNGHAIISPNECRLQTGLLDLKDNIEASDMGDHYHGADNYSGGGFFSSLKKMAGKVGHYVKKGKAAYDKGKALYDQHSDTINKGIAMAKGVMGNQGGSVTGGSIVGGSMVGGYMSRRR